MVPCFDPCYCITKLNWCKPVNTNPWNAASTYRYGPPWRFSISQRLPRHLSSRPSVIMATINFCHTAPVTHHNTQERRPRTTARAIQGRIHRSRWVKGVGPHHHVHRLRRNAASASACMTISQTSECLRQCDNVHMADQQGFEQVLWHATTEYLSPMACHDGMKMSSCSRFSSTLPQSTSCDWHTPLGEVTGALL